MAWAQSAKGTLSVAIYLKLTILKSSSVIDLCFSFTVPLFCPRFCGEPAPYVLNSLFWWFRWSVLKEIFISFWKSWSKVVTCLYPIFVCRQVSQSWNMDLPLQITLTEDSTMTHSAKFWFFFLSLLSKKKDTGIQTQIGLCVIDISKLHSTLP